VSDKKIQDRKPIKKQANPYPNNERKKFKKKKRTNWLWIWLGLTGVAMLSATAGAMLAVSLSGASPLQQAELTPEQEAIFSQDDAVSNNSLQIPQLNRPVNILVLGIKVLTSDVKDDNGESQKMQEDLGYQAVVNSFDGLADTMLLLRFDPNTKKMTLLSIPRDTRAEIEGHGINKINAANYEGGPALAAQTVSNLLGGVQIDRYMRVNVQGVEKFIDALGGVTIDVPKDMKYIDESQHLYIDLKKGKQHLTGAQALGFLRYRYDAYGDISRIQRQQSFMRALVEQALSPSIIVKVPEILSVVQSHIDTNLSVKELVALTGFGTQTKRSNMQMLMLPGGFSGDGKKEVSYWLPDETKIQEMMAQYFGLTNANNQVADREPTALNIAIQDSTGDEQAVQAMIKSLKEAGYRRVYTSSSLKEPISQTRIVAQKGDGNGASSIKNAIGLGDVVVESTGELTSDVTIQLGEDWRERVTQIQQQ
jgi:LCP family protein required for cell wall assembly